MLARRPQRRETAAPAPRAGHSATVIPYYDEEAVLVLGGFDGDSVLALDEANVFVPSLERWEQLDTRPPTRSECGERRRKCATRGCPWACMRRAQHSPPCPPRQNRNSGKPKSKKQFVLTCSRFLGRNEL
jgi:hypothetical protein